MKRSFDILDLNNCLECFKKVVNNKKTKKIVISSIISAITLSTVGCIDQESFSKMLHENNIPIFSNSNNEKTKETELKSQDTIQNDVYTETDVITEIKPLEEDSCIEEIINEVITNPNDNTNISDSKEIVFDDSIGVPVLMYHNIVEDESKVKHDRYQITTENLENQLLYLKNNGYTTICLNDLYEYMINKMPIPKNSVVITFDDGYYSNYKYLYELLKKHDMHADIGVITGLMNEKGKPNAYFTWEHAQEMQDSGYVDIVSHTVSHDYLDKIPQDKLITELVESEKSLKNYLGEESDILVIPYGSYNDKIIEESKSEYKMIISINAGLNYSDGNIYKIKRFEIHNSHTGSDLIDLFNKYNKKK